MTYYYELGEVVLILSPLETHSFEVFHNGNTLIPFSLEDFAPISWFNCCSIGYSRLDSVVAHFLVSNAFGSPMYVVVHLRFLYSKLRFLFLNTNIIVNCYYMRNDLFDTLDLIWQTLRHCSLLFMYIESDLSQGFCTLYNMIEVWGSHIRWICGYVKIKWQRNPFSCLCILFSISSIRLHGDNTFNVM